MVLLIKFDVDCDADDVEEFYDQLDDLVFADGSRAWHWEMLNSWDDEEEAWGA